MTHEMKLKPQYFDLIKCGKKIYEVRLNDEKRQLMKVGDSLVFKREPEMTESLKTTIDKLLYFESFEEMSRCLDAKLIGFENATQLDVLNLYYKFYSKEDENKYGVVAIKVNTKKK